ncbi:MAG: Gfo/Idh/MocA family oxidoreductase [Deltaproteobacteria bacterium]|nr:Gfo/Idh/MocA family oxidoreductase [Deltaproteobacteria bacterium]MBW2417254.1 Gfo/Idh/MocA family oxidoreductase [Deltaproteobacteria bacterium]
MRALRIAVVGAGHMGKLHAAKIAELAESGDPVRLSGVADVDAERARALAERRGVRGVTDYRDLLGEADAVIVAVPTLQHFEVVRGALAAGRDVLVEKPIAASIAEGEALLELATAQGCLLQVGHLEWFNNAMQVIRERIHRPRFIEAHRMGPFPDRATDIDVVRDLMIHDLDILQQLLGEEPERIEAVGVPVLSPSADIANARITYPGGCVANLTASRVSSTPMRKVRFFQRDGYFSIDFLEQSALVIRRELSEATGAPEIKLEKLDVDRGDALLGQLRAFLGAVRDRGRPAIDAAGGLGALRTALRVLDAMPHPDEFE